MKVIRPLCLVSCSLLSVAVHAELPLAVEGLITDASKVKLDASLAYGNSDRQGVSTGDPIIIQTGATSFVSLPTVIGESQGNSDFLVVTLGMRYGLSGMAEVYARTSHLHSRHRNSDMSGVSSSSESRFGDAWAGINYLFKQDDDTPALLGFAEVALREKHRDNSNAFKSAMLGLTTYKAIDPVVFSLTTAYRVNQVRPDGNADYKPGNLLLVNPSIGFAANDRVTLTTGFQWTNRQADRLNGKDQGFRRTSTDLLLGLGYGSTKENTLNFTFKANASGRSGADLRLNWQRTY